MGPDMQNCTDEKDKRITEQVIEPRQNGHCSLPGLHIVAHRYRKELVFVRNVVNIIQSCGIHGLCFSWLTFHAVIATLVVSLIGI